LSGNRPQGGSNGGIRIGPAVPGDVTTAMIEQFRQDRAVRREDIVALNVAVGSRSVTLASASPRRRELLQQCKVRFRVVASSVIEPLPEARDIGSWARRWALRKALDILGRTDSELIWGADTVVALRGRGFGKPADPDEAEEMLARLSGKTHEVITAVAAITGDGSRRAAGTAISRVTFRPLARAEIKGYIATGEPFDKAGAYAIQGKAGTFVKRIEGPLDNIIGLPVGRLAQVTRRITHER